MPLDRYLATSLPYEFILESGWWNIEGFRGWCRTHPVSPQIRMVLSSDGSLVKNLSAYFLSPVQMEVPRQTEIAMDGELSKFLELPEGSPAIARDVWMAWEAGRGGPKKVFAHSVIDSSSLSPEFLQALSRRTKPIGALLEEFRIPVLRDHLHIGRLESPKLSRETRTAETVFWARCFRLQAAGEFRAAILEVLLPETFNGGMG